MGLDVLGRVLLGRNHPKPTCLGLKGAKNPQATASAKVGSRLRDAIGQSIPAAHFPKDGHEGHSHLTSFREQPLCFFSETSEGLPVQHQSESLNIP